MTHDDAGIEGRTAALLDRLRDVAARTDPVPAALVSAASAALGFRDPDAALAALVADSDAAEEPALLLRGPQDTTRLLTFEADDLLLEVQVTSAGGACRLEGQVDGIVGRPFSLEHAQGVERVEADGYGRFRVAAVPFGRMRFVLGGGEGPVHTAWVLV